MVPTRTVSALSAAQRASVTALLQTIAAAGGAHLNDHLASDLVHGPRPGFVAVLAGEPDLLGYAQASAANDGFVIGAVVAPCSDVDADAVRRDLLGAVLAQLPPTAPATWWTSADSSSASVAGQLGLRRDRELLNMRRGLPIAERTQLVVRPFRVGVDESEWLEVNNAAFSWHAEQGGWDIAALVQRQQEPWFDPAGFLIHERDGRMAGFCWTKIHGGPITVGEIYVIAVHPDFHGHGLGRALTVAGLQHLYSVGATEAMLYVDADNTAAVRLYTDLAMTVAHVDQSYSRPAEGIEP